MKPHTTKTTHPAVTLERQRGGMRRAIGYNRGLHALRSLTSGLPEEIQAWPTNGMIVNTPCRSVCNKRLKPKVQKPEAIIA